MLWVHNATPEVNGLSEYPKILGVCISLTIVMWVIVGMRAYVRLFMVKSFGADDWTICAAALCSTIYNALCIGQSRWGLGLPVALRPPKNLANYTLLNFPGRPFYMMGILGFKVALCLAYLRIVNRDNRFYRPLIWIIMIACILGHIGGTLVLIFQCRPVQKSWEPLIKGYCLPNDITFYVLAAITIFFDCIIFTLPIPLLAKVQINTRRKVGLIGVFVLGLFTTVCSVLRMIQIIQISKDGNATGLVLWGTIELNVGISLTCIPALTPLFAYFREKTTTARTPKNTGGSSSNDTHSHVMQRFSRRSEKLAPEIDDSESQQTMVGQSAIVSRAHSGEADGSARKDFGTMPRETDEMAEDPEYYHAGSLGGITRTTELDVKVSRTGDDKARQVLGAKW